MDGNVAAVGSGQREEVVVGGRYQRDDVWCGCVVWCEPMWVCGQDGLGVCQKRSCQHYLSCDVPLIEQIFRCQPRDVLLWLSYGLSRAELSHHSPTRKLLAVLRVVRFRRMRV